MALLIDPFPLDASTEVGIDLAAQIMFGDELDSWVSALYGVMVPSDFPNNQVDVAVSGTFHHCFAAMLEAELGRKKFSCKFPRGTRKFYEANGEMLSCLKGMTDYFYGHGYAGHYASAFWFAEVVVEKEIFTWFGQDNVDGEVSTKTAIQKIKRHQNGQLGQDKNPFKSEMTRKLFDEAVKQADGRGVFYKKWFHPFLKARRESYKACEEFNANRKDGNKNKPLRQGRKKKHEQDVPMQIT